MNFSSRAAAAGATMVVSNYDRVQYFERDNRHDEALAVCSDILRSAPADTFAVVMSGHISFRKKDFAEAEKFYQKAYELNYIADSVESLIEFGRILGYNSKREKALEVLEKALSIKPAHYDALIAAGQVSSWSGNYILAEEYYRRAIKSAPESAEASIGLAMTLHFKGAYRESALEFDALMKKHPDDYEVKVSYAQCLAWRGSMGKSSELLRTVLAAKPDHQEALYGLGRIFRWQKKYVEALSVLKKLLSLKVGPDFDVSAEIAGVYMAIGEFDRAESIVSTLSKAFPADKRVKKIKSDLVSAMHDRAVSLTNSHKYEESGNLFKKVLSRDPANPGYLKSATLWAIAAEKPDEARKYITKAAGLKPGDAEIRMINALFLESVKEYARAIEIYRGILSGECDRGTLLTVRYGLAKTYFNVKDYLNSLEVLLELVADEPENAEFRILRAKNYIALGMIDYAEIELEEALTLDPKNDMAASLAKEVSAARVKFARELADKRKFNHALMILERVLAKSPEDLAALQYAGYVRGCMEDMDECFANYEKVLSAVPGNNEAKLQYARFKLFNLEKELAYRLNSEVVAEEPRNTEALMGQADCLASMRKHELAIDVYKKVLEIKPDFLQPKLDIALNHSWMKKYDQALAEYSAILKTAPDCQEALAGLARTSAWAGKLNDSYAYYKKAMATEGAMENKDLLLGFGSTLHWIGMDEEAMDKVAKMKALKKRFKEALDLEAEIMKSHRNVAWVSTSRTTDSDKLVVASKGLGGETDLDLNTRIYFSHKIFDNSISGTSNAERAEVNALKAVRIIGDRLKASGGINVYGYNDAAGQSQTDVTPFFGITWRKFNETVLSFLIEKAILVDSPTLIRNRISCVTRHLGFQKYFKGKSYIAGSVSSSDYSDDNESVSMDAEVDFLARENRFYKLYVGPEMRRKSFDHKSAGGYYSPTVYNVMGLFYRFEYRNPQSNLSMVLNGEYGRQRTESNPAVAYRNFGISLYYAIRDFLNLEASYRTGNSAGVADTTSTGYSYDSWALKLLYRW